MFFGEWGGVEKARRLDLPIIYIRRLFHSPFSWLLKWVGFHEDKYIFKLLVITRVMYNYHQMTNIVKL